jgi:CheY-like chemotaxis protein
MAIPTQKRILLVDDNPIDLLVHRKMLEKAA